MKLKLFIILLNFMPLTIYCATTVYFQNNSGNVLTADIISSVPGGRNHLPRRGIQINLGLSSYTLPTGRFCLDKTGSMVDCCFESINVTGPGNLYGWYNIPSSECRNLKLLFTGSDDSDEINIRRIKL